MGATKDKQMEEMPCPNTIQLIEELHQVCSNGSESYTEDYIDALLGQCKRTIEEAFPEEEAQAQKF